MKGLQMVNKGKELTPRGYTPLLESPIESIADARKFLGRLILALQRDELDCPKARTMIYALIAYSQLTAAADFESRLNALEAKGGKK